MKLAILTPNLSALAQPSVDDIGELANRGYRSIIGNRSEGEAPDQPKWTDLKAAATAHRMEAVHIPVVASQISQADVRAFVEAMERLPKPISAFCRTYAAAGVVGAYFGSTAGKAFDGQRLLFLFALVMIAVGFLMLRGRKAQGDEGAECNRENAPKVLGYGVATGGFSGFFGIGGGFLIVPGLIASTGMPMINAVGTSLVAVTAFGLTTSANYALSGMVDWLLAGVFIAGGLIGSIAGTRAAKRLSSSGQLTTIFAVLIFVVAAYMLWKSAGAIF